MIENHADEIDMANETAAMLVDKAVEDVRSRAKPEYHPGFNGFNCVEEDCGAEIPAARVALGKVRCIDCQAHIERTAKRRQ